MFRAAIFLLGNFGNSITLDWAAADYKADERLGVRFGKVKTPSGLFNDIQDIDPSYIWSLLPQSVYPINSRNSILAHYGGVAYGTFKLGAKAGKLEYRGWGGERQIGSGDGYLLVQAEAGLLLPNGLGGATYGAAVHWRTPLSGLMIGASDGKDPEWTGQAHGRQWRPHGNRVDRPPERFRATLPSTRRIRLWWPPNIQGSR